MAGSTACSLEELIAAETSKGSVSSEHVSFAIILDNIYILVQHFITKGKLFNSES